MFKRQFTSKTTTPLRSSDLRKLRDEVSTSFDLAPSLALKLLPDGTTTTLVRTHLDEPCTLYASNNDCLFFRIGKGNDGPLVPTVYTFDLLPDFLPALVTAPEVVEHLVSGSALFSAGVSDRSLSALPDSMLDGSLVAVVAQGSPIVVAVGQLAASKKELVADRKGKAVLTLHARGDFLHKAGSEVVAAPLVSVDAAIAGIAAVGLEGPPPAFPPAEESTTPSSEAVTENLSPADVDLILRGALLLAIKSSLSKAGSASLFPMPASSLYSAYILPFRPHNAAAAEIKKSSFKKLAGFIKAVTKAGYLVSKEIKGDLMIMSVVTSHADVASARSYKTVAQAGASAASAAATSSTSSSSIVVRELFKPASAHEDLFLPSAIRHDTNLYLPTELKKVLTDYIASANLTHPNDQKYIKPNSVVSHALLKKGEVLDVMTKDDAFRRFKDGCTKFFEIKKEGEEAVVKKGSPPMVKIAIKTVGKRQVTLVSGHEAWGLFTSEELAEDLRHKAASSTAVQQITGSSPKAPKFEVMVQGSHESLVTQALVTRGLPKQYIEVDTSKLKR